MPTANKLTQEIGASGTLIFKGHIVAEEYNRRLQDRAERLRVYDIMSRSDPDIHAVLELVKLPVLAATWNVKAAHNPDGKVDDADQKIADRIEYELFHNNLNFDDFLYQSCDMLDYGFSVMEKVLGLHDYNGERLWGIDRLSFRKQTSIYAWTTSHDQPGITQRTLDGNLYDIPAEKLIVFTNKKRGDNYEGISLLRYIYRDWDMKDKLTLVNAMALEQLAKGIPVLSIDPTSTVDPGQTDMDAAEEALKAMRVSNTGYLRLPKGAMVEMLDMKQSSVKDVLPTLAMHRRAIFSSIVATFMDMGGSAGSGAKALSEDLTALFLKSEEYIAKTIAAAINSQLIKPLCDLNYSNLPNGYPQLTCGNIADDDITALSAAVNQLMTAGALTPDADMEDVLRTKMGMPNMPEDVKANYTELQQVKHEQAINPPAPVAAPPQDTKPTKSSVIASANKVNSQLIDILVRD